MRTLLSFFGLSLFLLSGCDTPDRKPFTEQEVYRSDALIITQISPNSFIHTSYHQTEDFGNVPCNGLVVRSGDQVIVFDTPTKDHAAEELIRWTQTSIECSIVAVVPTHFHVDCLGGLQAFHTHGIASYANVKTAELAQLNGTAVPQNGIKDSITFDLGSEKVEVRSFGAGHTIDNVVGYFPSEGVLFGGCLIKELDATKGYLGDADVEAWPVTVERVKQAYPQVKLVIPGHGQHGDRRLLDYTIALFRAP